MQDSNEGSDKTGNLAKPGPNQDLNGHFPEMFRTCYFPEIFHDEKSPSVERHFTNVTLHRPNDRTADHTKETRHGIYELFAAWGLVLHLYGGETAISFGCTTNDGASQVLRIENTSTCRFEVHPDVMLQDIFRSIKVSQGSCPAIQDHGKAGKSKSRPYNTAFHIYDRHVKDDQIPSNADEFDLVLMVSLPIEVLEVTLSYRASFLSDKAAANVLYTFGQATRICSQEFHTLVRDMNLLSNWDFEQITQWNDHLPQPVPSCVHSLIEQHVRSQPEAPSIHAWDGKLTYKRLSILSSNLARYLVSIGIGVEQFVPLCFEKSMWAVVSLLAVLKAGAACAFIEPSHPMERIRSMLRSMDAKVVLCSRASSGIFISQPCTITNIIEVDAAFIDTIDLSSHFSPPSVQPTNAAILLFTSGSTGQPKGIVQEHSTTAFSAETLGGFLGIRKGSRCLQWAAYCFDMSVIDMLTALVQGACICIPSEKDRMEKLPEAIRDMRVDNAALTPSFAQTIKSACMPTLKTLVFGGEPVSRDDLIGWPEDVRIINGCGPAEASVCIAGEASLECPAKIGRAIGSVAWIVNENDYTRLAPIGVIGELLIEGPLLARGYLKDPDKTSRAFVKDPSWLVQLRKRSGLRLYRTGDLARWDTDGTIIFVGRKDSQVKLRGQRIEAGEVEHHLRKCLPSGTAVCVTIITPTGQGQSPKLAAFVGVGHKIHNEFSQALINLSVEERGFRLPLLQGLKERLSSSLPAYMVPSYYIPLTYIPLTVSGKINRQLLNEVGSSLTISDILELGTTNQGISDHTNSSLEIKNNTMERRMVELWKRILHCEDRILGPQDNFFKLGGDSINVMQLVKAAKDIGIGLDTTQAFQHPTVAGMSAVASQATTDPKIYPTQLQDPHKATSTDGLTDDVFCPGLDPKHDEIEDIADATDLQAYMVVCGLLKTRGYINYFAFDLTGPIDADRLEQACCSLVQRHSALRTVFGLRAGRVLQIVLKAMNLEFVRSADCPRTETLLAKLCEVDKACSAQLGDKIVRFMFASRDPHKHVLIMRISHAQFDGTSLGLIYRDLKLAYQGAIIPPGPNFIDVSLAMQHANNSSAELFWSKLLHKSSMTSIIHQSRTSFAHVINSRVTTLIPWPSIQSHIPGITIATIVKAAWALVLSSLSSSKDIVFAYAVAGRNIPLSGIDHVVGDCNNAALLRLQLSQHHTILSLLEEIQTQYLAMIPYETMGMRQVIERCTDWPRWTRYSSSVNHQNYADAGVDEFHFGEKEEVGCRVSYRDLEADRRDVQIYSWPPREGYLRVDMAFCKDAIPHAVVENMLGELAATILHVATKADTPLIIPPSIPSSESLPRLPIMAANHHLANSTTISQPAPPPQPAPIAFRFSLLNPESIVKTVWTKFLATLAANNPIRNGLEEIVTSDTPFYDLGGDLVDAAQLSAFYEQEGVVITMEELIEWPTQRGQRGLVGGLLL